MKICEYTNNLTDIKYIQMLILNEFVPKRIEISKDIHENYNISYLFGVIPEYHFNIYTVLRIKLRNIRYPYLTLSDVEYFSYIWERKTSRIDTLKYIWVMFK